MIFIKKIMIFIEILIFLTYMMYMQPNDSHIVQNDSQMVP